MVKHRSTVINSNSSAPPSRRAQITEIAARIFADRGYYGARLEDVAKQLDVTRASLYYHVKNKEAILKEICDNVLKAALEDSRKIEKSDLSPLEKLRLYIRGKVVSTAERRELCVVLFEQAGALNTRSYKRVRRQMREFDEIIIHILEEGIEQGYLKIDDVRIASLAIQGACFWTYHWFNPTGRLNPDQVATEIINLLENGYIKTVGERHVSSRTEKKAQHTKTASPIVAKNTCLSPE